MLALFVSGAVAATYTIAYSVAAALTVEAFRLSRTRYQNLFVLTLQYQQPAFSHHFDACLVWQATFALVLHIDWGHCSGRLRFSSSERKGALAATQRFNRCAGSAIFLLSVRDFFALLTIAVLVVVVLCFGDGDSATIGLMVMCGFVCATGVVASTGGRAYVSSI